MYLDASGDIAGEKRVVSIIFSGAVGFAALSEKYADEPEELQRIVNECLRRQAEQIHELEGYIDKFVGDELLALFGAPIWHEDDAQRAVTAAIRMRNAVEEYGNELKTKEGIQLDVRIGINTGEVSVGNMGDDMFMNYTVMGDPVNLAARIEHIAEAGEVIVGESTYELTKELFDYKEPRYVDLKGKTGPQPVYELIVQEGMS
jgi:class 3 adenylate cyclase